MIYERTMCGVTGFWTGRSVVAAEATRIIGEMNARLAHRGPDDAGEYFDAHAGLALGQRRLSIIDLSPAGHQPMTSASGRYVISYNGEAYNFHQILKALREDGWNEALRGGSDTEVVLAAIEHWGLQQAVSRLHGMFAIALWDQQKRRLHLVRDRLGIKPLYYGRIDSGWVFGSELRALQAHPGFESTIDREALSAYFKHAFVPGPRSILANASKVPPGVVLTFASAERPPRQEAYWSLTDTDAAAPLQCTHEEAQAELRGLLEAAAAQRTVADVPLGAFLSGGVDSSLVVALLQKQSRQPVRTFAMGFEEGLFNEAPHAERVAAFLGTEHTTIMLSADKALAVIDGLANVYDEPFADPSQVPTLLLSQVTRKHVTVALSGDGGDEVFMGYNRYVLGTRLWERIHGWPIALRRRLAAGLGGVSPSRYDALYSMVARIVPRSLRLQFPGQMVHKLAAVIDAESPSALFERLAGCWPQPESLVVGGSRCAIVDGGAWDDTDFARAMTAHDLRVTLPDDMLVKVDRASMAFGLEVRVPLLDHRVVEFARRLPTSWLLHEGQGKRMLRDILFEEVPREYFERPKAGFGVPIADWLRGPLRAWAEAGLDETRLRREGLLHPEPIRRCWEEHLSARVDRSDQLWSVLMFQAWLARQG